MKTVDKNAWQKIVQAISKSELTINEIATQTGLKYTTVYMLIKHFAAQGEVVKQGESKKNQRFKLSNRVSTVKTEEHEHDGRYRVEKRVNREWTVIDTTKSIEKAIQWRNEYRRMVPLQYRVIDTVTGNEVL